VYTGDILRRPCGFGNLQISYQYPHSVINVVKNQESLCTQKEQLSFTTIVIRLRDSIREQLQFGDRYVDLPNQISEIYYFHLHPENSPNRTTERYSRTK
jgi:hypothetical protein